MKQRGFEASSGEAPTLHDWAGGLPAFLRLTTIFYEKYVADDPLLAPLFADRPADHPQRVAEWLAEVFGGTALYTERHGGYDQMVTQHRGRALTEEQRARWILLMTRSADEASLPADAEFRAAFVSYLEWGSRIALENSRAGAHPPIGMPVPRWTWVNGAAPGARISAVAQAQPDLAAGLPPPADQAAPPVASTIPQTGETISYARDVKPLFRASDRQSMAFAFDLWSYHDVKTHAEAILSRLRQGSMPCDGAWTSEQVDLFSQWLDLGAHE